MSVFRNPSSQRVMKGRFEKHREFLVDRIDPDFGLLDMLLASRTLTREAVHKIKLKDNTTEDKNRILLDFILKDKKAKELVSALTDCGQTHLVNYLNADGGAGTAYGDDWPLSEPEIIRLEINRESLVDLLDMSNLYNGLLSEKVLKDRQRQFVCSKPTDAEKNEALLDILTRCSLRQYKRAIACMNYSNQSHVAKILSKGVVVRVHANIEGAVGIVDAMEAEIISQLTKILENRPLDEVNLLMEPKQLRIIAARKGHSVVIYFHCMMHDELPKLVDPLETDELTGIVQRVFTKLLSITDALTVTLTWSQEEFGRAAAYFENSFDLANDGTSHFKEGKKNRSKLLKWLRNIFGKKKTSFNEAEIPERNTEDSSDVSLSRELEVFGLNSPVAAPEELPEPYNYKRDFAKKLRSKYSHISNGLIRTEDIVAELFQTEILSARERDDIQQLLSTPVRASEQLLNTLILKDLRAYECFLTALCNTDQKHIADILTNEDEYIDTGHSFVIQTNYATLVDNLDVDSGLLLDRLYEAGLLTQREMATINARPTKHERCQTLLDLVSKWCLDNFNKFLHALENASQKHVVFILSGKPYSKNESTDSSSKAVQPTLRVKHYEKGTNPPSIPVCEDDSNQVKDIRITSNRMKLLPFDVKIKSFKMLQATFIKLPDELQTELFGKVSELRQKTTLPSDANVGMFYHALLQDNTEKILELEQKHKQQRKTWIEEKDENIKQIQELYDGAELRYKSDPVLVQTIRTEATEVEKNSISGLTILDIELFVVSRNSSQVEVYDSMTFSFSHRWNLKELSNPMDIGSCNTNKCIYIYDYKGPTKSMEILRVDTNAKIITKWFTGAVYGWGLSVTDESNVIVTVFMKNILNEYSSDGQLIREINLSSDAGILHPWHAMKLKNGNFLVSHGCRGYDLHRVYEVDGGGKLKKSFGGKRGSTIGQMNCPMYLAVDASGFVMVADQENFRVLLLDTDLEFKREILSREKHGLRRPEKILLDQTNGRVFVADNELDNERILVFILNN